MQSSEFFVVREREVEVSALEIRPSVTLTPENAIEGSIDFVVFVRPQPSLGFRVHPRMHRPRHEPSAEIREPILCGEHAVMEGPTQA